VSSSAQTRRLLWQCRRGTRELDVALERFVLGAYTSASSAQRAAFARLLELPDDTLMDYLYGYAVPDDADLAEIVGLIATPHRS
jgi:antitoxin CptB